MRLTNPEMVTIRNAAAAVFGPTAQVRLFGSRLDDTLSDGDIDLFIEVDKGRGSVGTESWFRERVADALGSGTRLDVLVHERGRPLRPIERLAAATGVTLAPGTADARQRSTTKDMMKLARDLVAEALAMTDRDLEQLLWLQPIVSDLLPVSAAGMQEMPRERLVEIDAFLKRFENAQDIVQRRLFRAVLMAEGESIRGQPAAEIADQLQARGALASAAQWKALAELRNRLSHDCPLDPDIQASRINAVNDAVPVLVDTVDAVKRYVDRQGLLSPSVGVPE